MSDGWEGNRRSGVVLAMRHRLVALCKIVFLPRRIVKAAVPILCAFFLFFLAVTLSLTLTIYNSTAVPRGPKVSVEH